MSLLLWVFCLVVLCVGIRVVVAPTHRQVAMKVIFLPGYLLAAALRILGGLLVRAPIRKVSPPWQAGEAVELGPSRLPVVGAMATAVLPLAVCLGLIVHLHAVLDPSLRWVSELPLLEPSVALAATVAESACEVASSTGGLVDRFLANPIGVALLLYLALALLIHGAPETREFVPVTLFVVALFVPVAAVDWLGLVPGFLSRGWFLQRAYGPAVYEAVAMLFSLALLTLALVLPLRLAQFLRGGKAPGKGGGPSSPRPTHAARA